MTTRRSVLLGGAAVAVIGATAAYAVVRDMGSLDDYDAAMSRLRATLRQTPDIAELVRYATLAPSGHNTQPWKLRSEADRFTLFPDFSRRTPIVDPDDHHLFVSLGSAAENLMLANAARGRPSEFHFSPSGEGSVVLALGTSAPTASALFDAIPKRQSSRADYDGTPVSAAELETLARAASIPGVDVMMISDRPQLRRVRDLVIAGNTAQLADQAFVRELRFWLRFSPSEAIRKGDGLFSATTGNPILPSFLGPLFFDLAFKAETENDKYARQIASSAGIAVFVAEKEDHEHWVLAGRACQRFALQATALGIKHAFINQPVEVPGLRPELANLIGLHGRRPDLVMRFGYGPMLPYSARRPVDAVLIA